MGRRKLGSRERHRPRAEEGNWGTSPEERGREERVGMPGAERKRAGDGKERRQGAVESGRMHNGGWVRREAGKEAKEREDRGEGVKFPSAAGSGFAGR